MKRFFTLLTAVLSATMIMAQAHGTMKFVGVSETTVATTNIEGKSDTISFAMNDATSGNITLPEINGMSKVPSFTINGATFTMGDDHVVTFGEQTFTSSVTVNGEEKTITGHSLNGTYDMADNSLTLNIVMQYGKMPLKMNYTIKAYYVKAVSNPISVTVAGQYTYTNDNVTYNVRKYKEGDTEKLDVEIPEYSLSGTVMGDLTLGRYVVTGLVYDETRGGYYHDYKDDNLTFHFKAVSDGTTTMDGDYAFNSAKDNNILVTYTGNNVTSIVNTFQMGAMPFPIVSTFKSKETGIKGITTERQSTIDGQITYSLSGQRVAANAKGIVIRGGKKYINR